MAYLLSDIRQVKKLASMQWLCLQAYKSSIPKAQALPPLQPTYLLPSLKDGYTTYIALTAKQSIRRTAGQVRPSFHKRSVTHKQGEKEVSKQ